MKQRFFFLKILGFIFFVTAPASANLSMTLNQNVKVEGTSGFVYKVKVDSKAISSNSVEATLRTIKGKLGRIPIEKVIVFPQNRPTEEYLVAQARIKDKIKEIFSDQREGDIKSITIPPTLVPTWFDRHERGIFTVVRFFVNGTAVGATLIYSWEVPLSKAFIVGILSGTSSGALQYKVETLRNWLRAGDLQNHFGASTTAYNDGFFEWTKRTYNASLDTMEEFSKFGVTEFSYIFLAKLAMNALGIGEATALPQFMATILTTATQSTLAQGTADIGLFSDITRQIQYNSWSIDHADVFRNSSALGISALSVIASISEMVSPGASGSLSLGLIEMPYGFVAVSLIGAGFYIHGVITEWRAMHPW